MPVVLGDFVSLFYPRCCQGCQEVLVKGEEVICTACIRDLPRTNFHRDPQNELFLRIYGRIPVSHAVAFLRFGKSTMVQKLLHALKYRKRPDIGFVLGQVYGQELLAAGFNYDLIVPVPLHRAKLRSRGYNQSAHFAQGLAASMKIPALEDALVRVSKTTTQTRRTKLDRWNNVKSAFQVQAAVPGTRILLVDDVVTTGATLEACTHTLLIAGAAKVGIACIAVA